MTLTPTSEELCRIRRRHAEQLRTPATPEALALRRLAGRAHRRRRLELELERGVADARRHGATWRAIAEALGTSRQAAHKRYAHQLEETPRD